MFTAIMLTVVAALMICAGVMGWFDTEIMEND